MKFENKKKVDKLCENIEAIDLLIDKRESIEHISFQNYNNSNLIQCYAKESNDNDYRKLSAKFISDYFDLLKAERDRLVKELQVL